MSDEMKMFFAVGLTLLFGLFGKKIFRRRPATGTFTCYRCGAISAHSARTMDALREGKARLFCRSCHHKWLSTQPSCRKTPRSPVRGASSSGCLGVVLVIVALPMLGIAAWACL